MAPLQNAAEEVVPVPLHAADGDVARRFGAWDVQVHGDVFQLCPLQLVDRRAVARADGVRRDVAAILHVVGHWVDGQLAAGFGAHVQALRAGLVPHDRCLHPIDEVCLLVDVAGQVQAHALVELHVQGGWRAAGDELVVVVLVVVGRIGLPVHWQGRQLSLLPCSEEDPDGEVIHQGRRPPGARGDGGSRVAPVQLLQIPGCRILMPRPGLVSTADVLQLLLARHGCPQELQLFLQDLVFAPPHLMQSDLVHRAPPRAVRGLRRLMASGAEAGQLPKVSGENKGRQLVCGLPHLDDPLKVRLGQLRDLVDGNHVVLRQAIHHFESLPVEKEGSRAGVHLRLRVLRSHPRSLLCGGQGVQDPATLP